MKSIASIVTTTSLFTDFNGAIMDSKVAKLLANVFNIRPEDVNESLQKEHIPKWDSLTHMDLIATIEQTYNIELSFENIVEMTSVNNILAILKLHGVDIHA